VPEPQHHWDNDARDANHVEWFEVDI